MQNQGITDVNSLFSQFLNKPTQTPSTNAVQTYTPIRQEQGNLRMFSSLKGLAVVGAAGIGLYAVYAKGKKVGEGSASKLFDEKLGGLKDELAQSINAAIKKNKPEVTQKEIDKILAQIKQLGANDTKAQETLTKILTSIKEVSQNDEKAKTALTEAIKKLFEEAQTSQKAQGEIIKTIVENGQKTTTEALNKGVKAILDEIAKIPTDNGEETQKLIKELSNKITTLDGASQKAILEAISNASAKKVVLDETSVAKITQSVAQGFEKLTQDDKASQKAILDAVAKISEELKGKKEISVEDIKKVVSECIGAIDFKGKTALDNVMIANIIANCTKTIEKENSDAFTKISQEIISQLDKTGAENKKSFDEISKLITEAMQKAGEKGETTVEITPENIEKIVNGIKDGLTINATGEISAENVDKIIEGIKNGLTINATSEISQENIDKIIEGVKKNVTINTTGEISAENVDKIIAQIQNGLKIEVESTCEISAENIDKIIEGIKNGLTINATSEITAENIEKIIEGVKNNVTISATGEITQENIDKIIKAVNETLTAQNTKAQDVIATVEAKKPYIKPEVTVETIKKLEQKEPVLLLEAPSLSRVKFEKGVAYGINGEKYTGIIEDTLKSGEKIQLEIEEGLIKKSTKTAQNGEKIFEKTYQRAFIPEKNIQKTMITTADNSDIERVYTSFKQEGTKNSSFNIIEKFLNDKIKREVTRFEANDKAHTLIKVTPEGYMSYSKSFKDGSAKLANMQPATKYKNIGTDSNGFTVFKIDA